MRTFITALADLGGPHLGVLALGLCLVHCGPDETTPGGSSTGTTEPSSGVASETSGMPDVGDTDSSGECLVEVWSLVHDQDGWSGGEGGLARVGAGFQAVGRLGGASVTLAVTGDGDLAWGPTMLGGADPEARSLSGVVGLASGDALTITRGAEGAWLQRWSATGDSTGPVAIPGAGYHLGPAALTPGGAIVAGGFVGASELEGEAVLMSLSEDGAPAWDIRLEHNQVLAVEVDPAGTIFVLAIDRYTEGGDVYLAAVEPTGQVRWDALAGSNTGFSMMGALTPFAVAADGQGGAYTLGQAHRLQTQDKPATDERLLARYHPTGELAWELREGASEVIEGGALAISDEWLVSAVESRSGTSVAVHRIDGSLVCERHVPERRVSAAVAGSPGEVVLTGRVAMDGPLWLAKYRVAAGSQR